VTFRGLAVAAIIGAALASVGVPALARPAAAQDKARVEVAFTPGDDIAGLIVDRSVPDELMRPT